MAEDKKKIIIIIFAVTLILSTITIMISVKLRNNEILAPTDTAAEAGNFVLGGRLYCNIDRGQLALKDIEVQIINTNRESVSITTDENGNYSYSGFTTPGFYTLAVDEGQFEDNPETELVTNQNADQSPKYCGLESQNYDRCDFSVGSSFTDLDFSFTGCENLTGLIVTPTPNLGGGGSGTGVTPIGSNNENNPTPTENPNAVDNGVASTPTSSPGGVNGTTTPNNGGVNPTSPINPGSGTNSPGIGTPGIGGTNGTGSGSNINNTGVTITPVTTPVGGTLPSTGIFSDKKRLLTAAVVIGLGIFVYNRKQNGRKNRDDEFWSDYV